MPQGSYEISDELAVTNALRFVKEAGVDAVKLEGGARVASRVKAIVDAGVCVIGHLGLTPQSTASFGGYRVQGKSLKSFDSIYEDSKALVEVGISLLLLEAMPEVSAAKIAENIEVPVLGIGAGKDVDGQLVIMHDLMGFYQSFRPWFAKCYIPSVVGEFSEYLNSIILKERRGHQRWAPAHTDLVLKDLGRTSQGDGLLKLAEMAISKYIEEVQSCVFPNDDYIYPLTPDQLLDVSGSKYW